MRPGEVGKHSSAGRMRPLAVRESGVVRPRDRSAAHGTSSVSARGDRVSGFFFRRPFVAFVVMAYAWSWTFWTIEAFSTGPIAIVGHYAGGFGPMLAALVVVRAQGRSVLGWFKGLLNWRVSPWWYIFVLGLPALLVLVVSLIYGGMGGTLTLSYLPARLWAYVPTLLLLVSVGGGNEELGWRGFGLPDLQKKHGPVAATLILGTVWALWHLPLLATSPDILSGAMSLPAIGVVAGVTFLSIAAHAFWYTWVMNRTGSVLLCMLLHGSYNASNGLLLLVPEAEMEARYQTLLVVMTSVLIGSVLLLIAGTRGKLGTSERIS